MMLQVTWPSATFTTKICIGHVRLELEVFHAAFCIFLYNTCSYRYDWKIEETQKNILRTHTTAVTARMLYELGQREKFQPMKYFSIDRVFRNEALDATHLAEFHQIEGSVADYNLTLGDLMGMLHQFFSKMGRINITEIPYETRTVS